MTTLEHVNGQVANRGGWSNAPFDLSYRSRAEKSGFKQFMVDTAFLICYNVFND
nr:MAG TPA: hypothetical protein [Caudoviricetes sp.]